MVKVGDFVRLNGEEVEKEFPRLVGRTGQVIDDLGTGRNFGCHLEVEFSADRRMFVNPVELDVVVDGDLSPAEVYEIWERKIADEG